MLVRRHQILLKNEATEGADSSPDETNALTLAGPAQVRPNIETIDQAAPSGSLTRLKSVVGRAELGLTLPMWLIGSRDPKDFGASQETTLPAFHQALLSCGLKMTKASYLYVNTTAQTGVFVPGQSVSINGAAFFETVINVSRPRADGTSLLVLTFNNTTHLANGNSIEFIGGTGQQNVTATANGASVLRRGYLYRPVSRTTILVVCNHATWPGWSFNAGDLLVRSNAGATVRTTGWYAVEGRILAVENSYGGDATKKAFTIETTSLEPYFATMPVTKVDRVTQALYAGGGAAPTVVSVTALDSPSSTIMSRLDGLGRKVRGARGNMRAEGSAGQPVRLDFEMTGSMGFPEDGEILPGSTLIDLADVPRLEYAAVLLDGNPYPGNSLRFDLGNVVSPNVDYHGSNGVRGARIGDRNPTAFLDPLMQHPAIFDFYKKQLEATSVSLVAQVGWKAANHFLLHIPVGQLEVTDGERDGAVTAELNLRARYNGTDDQEFTLYAL